jgi:hypothetical protein
MENSESLLEEIAVTGTDSSKPTPTASDNVSMRGRSALSLGKCSSAVMVAQVARKTRIRMVTVEGMKSNWCCTVGIERTNLRQCLESVFH